MWRVLSAAIISVACGLVVQQSVGQDLREPYGPFDAIADGARSSEARNLSLIESQLDTVDYLRSITVPVSAPRVIYSRGPRIASVYSYGRRGLLGLRPQGYVVIRRTPIIVYRRTPGIEPPAPPVDPYGYAYGAGVRQPIGHESLQTGPNRWEYRPLYADDDRSLDETHRRIEENLRPESDSVVGPGRFEAEEGLAAENRSQRSTARQPAIVGEPASEPEELPLPNEAREPRRAAKPAPARGGARDIARQEEASDDSREDASAARRRDAADRDEENQPRRRASLPPPPPRPDPAVHPDRRESERGPRLKRSQEPANPDNAPLDGETGEVRGPLLQDPSTGTREF